MEVVERLWETITLTLGSSFSIEDIIHYTEQQRGRRMQIAQHQLPQPTTGYAVALFDCDLIVVRPDIEPVRRRFVVLHELAHFLLGHVQKVEKEITYTRFIHQIGSWSTIASHRRVVLQGQSGEEDQEAELFAARLLDCVIQNDITPPPAAQRLFGDTRKE